MRAYLGITDWDWFELLRAQPAVDEVNFWQPSPRPFRALSQGEPFLFKLHRPAAGGRDVIAGGGFFAAWTQYPASIAWDAFELANGARTLAEMRARIERYRRTGSGIADYWIGCILLTQPFFFAREEWIEVPQWGASTQVGKTMDPSEEPGRSIWRAVEERLGARRLDDAVEMARVVEEAPRYAEVVARQRLGQGSFRLLVTDAYERSCAVTREKALPVLEAAHIVPYAEGGLHRVDNGLLLRSDLHRLLDKGYVTVTPDLRLEVSDRLRLEFDNGQEYLAMRGREIWVPEEKSARPDPALLVWHNEHRFVA